MRKAFPSSLFFIGLILFIGGCFSEEWNDTSATNTSSPTDGATTPSSPIKVSLATTVNGINKISLLTITLETQRFWENASYTFTPQDGIKLLEGDTWTGNLEGTQFFQATYVIEKIGDYTLGAKAFLNGFGAGRDTLYLRIMENESFVSEAPFPLPATSDKATKIDDTLPVLYNTTLSDL